MPFRSEKQRRFMWSQHPDIAKKWAHGQHSTTAAERAIARKRMKKVKK